MDYPTSTVGTKRPTKSAWPDWQHGQNTVNSTLQYGKSLSDVQTKGQQSQPGHSTHTFTPQDVAEAKRSSVAPTVLDVNPKTPSQRIVLKHRASSLIQQYSGPRWREAQRTKWLLDIVMHIDRDYRQQIAEQAAEIEVLHQQLQQTTGLQTSAAELMQAQNAQLRRRVDSLEQQLRMSQGALLDMQNRIDASEIALNEAEAASRAAAEECHQLQQAVAVLAEHDASVRKLLANRAHTMKEALVASRGRVRQAAESSKRHRLEVADLLDRQKQQAEQERQALTLQHQCGMVAANTLLEAATRLNEDYTRLELEAYKEPWTYLYADKSPTKDKAVTRRLGLKEKSMNIRIPF